MKKWMLLILALAMLATGAISGLSFESTLRVMRAAASGQVGTIVMEHGDLYMLASQVNAKEWGFACVTATGNPVNDLMKYVNGTKVDTATMSSFLRDLENDGWKYISSKALPAGITSALGSYATFLVSVGARTLPDLFFVPVIILPTAQPTGTIQ